MLSILDNRWVSRAGNVSFLVGTLWSVWKLIGGNTVNSLALVLIGIGLILAVSQRLPRSPQFASDSPETNVFTGSNLKARADNDWTTVNFRLVGLPLYNVAKSTNAGAKEVTAIIGVFKPPGKVLIDRAHGLWRELEKLPKEEVPKAPTTGVARGIHFAPDRQRHVLNVLVQQFTENTPSPAWHIARDPLELSPRGFALPAGEYLMSITLRGPDLRKPVRLTFDLIIPMQGKDMSEENAPILIEHGRPEPDWIENQ